MKMLMKKYFLLACMVLTCLQPIYTRQVDTEMVQTVVPGIRIVESANMAVLSVSSLVFFASFMGLIGGDVEWERASVERAKLRENNQNTEAADRRVEFWENVMHYSEKVCVPSFLVCAGSWAVHGLITMMLSKKETGSYFSELKLRRVL